MQVWPSPFLANIDRIRVEMVESHRSQLDEKRLSVTGSAQQPLPCNLPRNGLDGAGIEFPGTAIDFLKPRGLGTLFRVRIETVDQETDKLGPIRSIERESLAKQFFAGNRLEPILAPSSSATHFS